MSFILVAFVILFGLEMFVQTEYIVSEPTIEILYPKGFTVSIPDDGHIKLFAFHGKINEIFEGREAGTFSKDIIMAKNGRWTFTDRSTIFKEGDKIYYWLYVINKDDGRGYLREDEHYTVTKSIDSDIIFPSQNKPTKSPTLTTSESPATIHLTNTELQRVVFLEQLELIRLQKAHLLKQRR